MTEVVGGLPLKDVVEGGTCFETKREVTEDSTSSADSGIEWKESDYIEKLESHLLVESVGVNIAAGDEPFSYISADMTNLLSNGKVKKRIIKNGYGPRVTQGLCVTIQYNAYVEFEAQPFDSTYGRNAPFRFTVGRGEVLEGLDVAVNSMQLSEKAQFLIHPDLAYKDSGLGRIKPDSIVLFSVELCQIYNSDPTTENVERKDERAFKKIYTECFLLNNKARDKFRLKDYSGASYDYNTAARKLENAILGDYNEQLKCDKLLFTLYSNLLICHTILENPELGCSFANKIYALASNKTVEITAKVFFNNAKCLRMLGGFQLAQTRLLKAKQMEPNNKEIDVELHTLNTKRDEYKRKMAQLGKSIIRS